MGLLMQELDLCLTHGLNEELGRHRGRGGGGLRQSVQGRR